METLSSRKSGNEYNNETIKAWRREKKRTKRQATISFKLRWLLGKKTV
jgi:hypothetical protein